MEKSNIKVNPKKCVECYTCQLACSFTYTKRFNPEMARIIIDWPNNIIFTEDCLSGCHICADYCIYGALQRVKK